MSAHVCGCDPEHTPAHECAGFPNCAYGRTLPRVVEEMSIPSNTIEEALAFLDREIDQGGSPQNWRLAQLIRREMRVSMNDSMITAWKLTHGDRRAAYGTPVQVFTGYAKIWSGILARKLTGDLTAADVALMMTALKLAREANAPGKDNVVDAHGYLIMLDEVKQ